MGPLRYLRPLQHDSATPAPVDGPSRPPEGSECPLPPLSLYIHIPWCLRKCPYCDFNSHALPAALDEGAYVAALLQDLEAQLPDVGERPLTSIFIGGGTPSLFSARSVGALLEGIAARAPLAPDLEVTLEANPGTLEAGRYAGYRAAGVNRLSIGAQSLDAGQLQGLGRIHGPEEIRAAVAAARAAGLDDLNLDLMYGLPGQSPAAALADLQGVIDLGPGHLSWYQLTLEPNTPFHHSPPPLPPDEALWEMRQAGLERLAAAGLAQYEVSAHARPGRRCRHNLNYWTFGDYLGIGAGAHGKLTRGPGQVLRRARPRGPQAYLRGPCEASERRLGAEELVLEFMLNALRLTEGVPLGLFGARTGLGPEALGPGLAMARERGLLEVAPGRLCPTELGRRFLDDLLLLFMPP